jgi:hypothetical protein
MSGKLNDLGKCFLYELGGKDLARPDFVWGEEERDSTGKGMPGAIENVEVGCCHLLETVDGHFALIRIVSKQERSATVQWILQPNGTTTFDIPKAAVVAVPDTSTEAPAQFQRNDASRRGVLRTESNFPALESLMKQPLVEALKTHLGNRRSIIQSLLEAVVDKECPVDEKATAVKALGEMVALEAAPTLAAMIGFFDRSAVLISLTTDECFPCVPALVRIGKPSVFACTKVLADAQSDHTLGLHAVVIVRVEGRRSAEVLLMDMMERVKDEVHRKNLEAVLQRIRTGADRLSVFDNMCTHAAGDK